MHRALDLLERFDDEHPVWTLAELTHASGLPKTTVLRLVTTLEQRGLVVAIGPGPATRSVLASCAGPG